ncbi:hypothetical protein ACQR2B_06820 [Bradyrhizobium oligotrophicum]|uniref:hypothetical protein n=1 Tax=Bradyrhizobium TaxID=374 RepID=UPI003EC1136F
MRVNVYAEEMPDEPRIEIIAKEIEGHAFTGLRIYLELPATVDGQQYQGPFIHRPGDDDSAAVTFWGKRDLRVTLRRALELLDAHYDKPSTDQPQPAVEFGGGWAKVHYLRELTSEDRANLIATVRGRPIGEPGS